MRTIHIQRNERTKSIQRSNLNPPNKAQTTKEMRRLITKEQREKVQKYEIDSRTAKGWQREDYKKLVILTNTDERGIYCLFVLCGTAAHPIVNECYKGEESRAKRIEGLKQTQDFREKRKEEE